MTLSPEPALASADLAALTDWYRKNQRDLPWRSDPQPWHVLVSEVMLQQTPVARVEPVYREWMNRWPSPRSMARAELADVIRAWGRLGYPRRAVRLHAAAVACVSRHDGCVPSSYEELLALPGVGGYTAAAVAAFAFGQRQAVLDTNVRRVQARWLDGEQYPRSASPTNGERMRTLQLLPQSEPAACEVSIALMELGALLCTAQNPNCHECPLLSACSWHRKGSPPSELSRTPQTYRGTDRQCRGVLLEVVKRAEGPVTLEAFAHAWPDGAQRGRCLGTLVADGLLQACGGETYGLPATTRRTT